MQRFYSIIRLFRILSLDVVSGSLATSFLVASFFQISPPFVTYIALGIAVWLIYTFDHLLDARAIAHPVTIRHSFHKTYFYPIVVFFCLILCTGVYILQFLSKEVIFLGLAGLGLTAIHLLLVFFLGKRVSPFVHKEVGVALNFAYGVAIPALSQLDSFGWEHFIFLFQVFTLAMMNLISFSFYEHEADQVQGQTSLSLSLGKPFLVKFNNGLYLTGVFIPVVVLVAMGSPHVPLVLVLIMGTVLWSLIRRPSFFGKHERYRIYGDLIFSLPYILLLSSNG